MDHGVRHHLFVTSTIVTGMVRMSDPLAASASGWSTGLVGLQQEMASDPAPETRAQLLQAREALIDVRRDAAPRSGRAVTAIEQGPSSGSGHPEG